MHLLILILLILMLMMYLLMLMLMIFLLMLILMMYLMIKLMDMFDDEADAPHYYDYLAATNRMMMNGVAKKNNTSINA